jgi:hypothetical protein
VSLRLVVAGNAGGVPASFAHAQSSWRVFSIADYRHWERYFNIGHTTRQVPLLWSPQIHFYADASLIAVPCHSYEVDLRTLSRSILIALSSLYQEFEKHVLLCSWFIPSCRLASFRRAGWGVFNSPIIDTVLNLFRSMPPRISMGEEVYSPLVELPVTRARTQDELKSSHRDFLYPVLPVSREWPYFLVCHLNFWIGPNKFIEALSYKDLELALIFLWPLFWRIVFKRRRQAVTETNDDVIPSGVDRSHG